MNTMTTQPTAPTTIPGIASRGRPLTSARPATTDIPWPDGDATTQDTLMGEGTDFDYHNLDAINQALITVIKRLRQATAMKREYERKKVTTERAYRSSFRRALVVKTGGSEASRKAAAEMECEELENQMIVAAQVASEYASVVREIRDELETLKMISYNTRSTSNVL